MPVSMSCELELSGSPGDVESVGAASIDSYCKNNIIIATLPMNCILSIVLCTFAE